MKFQLDQVAIFEDEEVIVWDYSHRYKEYDIKKQDGKIINGLSESELKEVEDIVRESDSSVKFISGSRMEKLKELTEFEKLKTQNGRYNL